MWTCKTNSSCENLIKYKINIWYIKNTLELMSKNWQCPKFSGDKYGQGSRLEDLTTAKQRQRRKEEEGRAAVACVWAQLRIVAVQHADDLTCGVFAMQEGSLSNYKSCKYTSATFNIFMMKYFIGIYFIIPYFINWFIYINYLLKNCSLVFFFVVGMSVGKKTWWFYKQTIHVKKQLPARIYRQNYSIGD